MKTPSGSIASMRELSRRSFFGGLAATATLDRIRAAVKPVRITDVEIFPVRIPVTDLEAKAGYMNRYVACRIKTDVGVTGYSFAGPPRQTAPAVKELLQDRD